MAPGITISFQFLEADHTVTTRSPGPATDIEIKSGATPRDAEPVGQTGW